MVSLKQVRESRARSATIKRSRVIVSRRPVSAPGRISLDKETILNMTPGQARSTLRHSTVNAFKSKGNKGTYLFALLLIIATQPTSAVNWGAYGKAMNGTLPPGAKVQASSDAGKIAQQAGLAWTAFWTRSGVAVTASALFAVFQDNYGKFLLTLALIALMVREYFHYKIKRGNQNLATLTIKTQEKTIERMLAALEKGQQPLVKNLASPAINAGPAPSNLSLISKMPNKPRIRR